MALLRMRQFEWKLERHGKVEQLNIIMDEYHDNGFLGELAPLEISRRSSKT